MSLNDIFKMIEQEVIRQRFALRIAAPFFFFFIALFRCYLESNVFVPRPYFSYYVALHHVLWYFTIILFIILATHLILKIAVEKLLWLMYGAVIIMIPIIVVMIQGKPMEADYLTGSFREIVLHIATLYFTYEKNLPLTAEVIIIFIGMSIIGYLYTKSIIRGLILGTTIYLGGNLLAISWLGSLPYTKAVFTVHSNLLNHPFMAVLCMHAVTFFSYLIILRTDLIKGERRYQLMAIVIAITAGSVYMLLVKQSGWFINRFDIVLTALPIWTTTFLAGLYIYRQHIMLSRWFWIIATAVLLFQWAVLGPIYLHVGVIKPLTVKEFWMLPMRVF